MSDFSREKIKITLMFLILVISSFWQWSSRHTPYEKGIPIFFNNLQTIIKTLWP